MFCDLARYELSVRGSMPGHDADPLKEAIMLLPDDSDAIIDLRDAAGIDNTSAAVLASAVRRGQLHGVEFSILVASEEDSASLAAAGLAMVTHRRRHHAFA
jgi:anti-anti-sigma regulatory factor